MLITKEIFETHVPAARMPERNTSVFERLTASFCISERRLVEEIVSPGLADLIEGDLSALAQRFVCLDAFLQVIHSLDLVLTATGFGIVSTESTAPASRARVDALADEVAVMRLLTIERIVDVLRQQPTWAASPQASACIPSLFFRPSLLPVFCGKSLTAANWELARQRATLADAHIQRALSPELFSDLLAKLRTASLSSNETELLNHCMRFYAFFIAAEEPTPNSPHQAVAAQSPNARVLLDAIIAHVEARVEVFPAYAASRLYKARHAEGYENQADDPTFFFLS